MTKLVNLDELAAPERKIKYHGIDYEVVDLNVQDFIEFQREFKELLAAQESGDNAVMLQTATTIVSRCIPTFSQANELNMRQLMATVQLVADFYPDVEADTPAPVVRQETQDEMQPGNV